VQEGSSSLVLDRHEQQQRPRGYAPGFRGALLVYGEERANAALIGELEQDGYEVRRASHPWTLAERCEPGQVDLVIFGMAPARGVEMLRALRANALAPGAASIPVLWMGTSSETTTGLLRAFDAGADDVTRYPLGYAELLACARARADASPAQPHKWRRRPHARPAHGGHPGLHG
jgi:DNA-binding response OmpR family regulator